MENDNEMIEILSRNHRLLITIVHRQNEIDSHSIEDHLMMNIEHPFFLFLFRKVCLDVKTHRQQ